jgi:hypothetical protein
MLRNVYILGFCFIIMISCDKESSDYRNKYTGNFTFTVVSEFWQLNQITQYDTLIFDGSVRLYADGDDLKDLSQMDFTATDSKRVTIEFLQGQIITPEIEESGEFVEAGAYHYHHSGRFVNNDEVEFNVGGLGGLGGGINYYIKGRRR